LAGAGGQRSGRRRALLAVHPQRGGDTDGASARAARRSARGQAAPEERGYNRVARLLRSGRQLGSGAWTGGLLIQGQAGRRKGLSHFRRPQQIWLWTAAPAVVLPEDRFVAPCSRGFTDREDRGARGAVALQGGGRRREGGLRHRRDRFPDRRPETAR